MGIRLFIVSVAFLSSVQAAKIIKRATGDCRVNGYTFKDGEPFTIPGYPPCIEYFCKSGQFDLIKDGCATDNNTLCHDVNSTWVKGCTTYTCLKSSKDGYTYYSTSVIASGCATDNNTVCHDVNSTWVKGCTTYTCLKSFKDGYTYLSTTVIASGCSTDNGTVCHDVNSTWVEQCRTLTCLKSFKDGYTYLSTSVTATQCPDDKGTCFNPGDVFTLTINKTIYTNCSCTTTPDGGVYYTCYVTAPATPAPTPSAG